MMYNNLMSTVVRKTFRSLETFLINLGMKIKPLTHIEGAQLRSPMIQCTKWLMREELQTFYKFIMKTYNIR